LLLAVVVVVADPDKLPKDYVPRLQVQEIPWSEATVKAVRSKMVGKPELSDVLRKANSSNNFKTRQSNDYCWFAFRNTNIAPNVPVNLFSVSGTDVGTCTDGTAGGISKPTLFSVNYENGGLDVLVKCDFTSTISPCGIAFDWPAFSQANWNAIGQSEECSPALLVQVQDFDPHTDCHGDCSCRRDPLPNQDRHYFDLALAGYVGGATNAGTCDCRDSCSASVPFPCDAQFDFIPIWPQIGRLFIAGDVPPSSICSGWSNWATIDVSAAVVWNSITVSSTTGISDTCSGFGPGNAADVLCDAIATEIQFLMFFVVENIGPIQQLVEMVFNLQFHQQMEINVPAVVLILQ